jgi:tripartite-type tricarboxylate transporter receptor subunit TctC
MNCRSEARTGTLPVARLPSDVGHSASHHFCGRSSMKNSLLAFAVMLAGLTGVQAQSYPSRPITIVAPFPAGGPSDTLARIMAEQMRATLGQPLIIENVGGAGGTIGTGRVARSAPDGYTLGVGNWTSHVGGPALYPIQYDALRDLQPISLLPVSPLMIAAHHSVPGGNAKDLIAWLKANPDKATAGTVGAGSPSHVLSVFFQKEAGVPIQLVPYRGGAPATQDLLSGQIALRIGTEASQMLPYLRSGQIKGLAMLGNKRWAPAPDIPTIDETGMPGFHMSLWFGLWAPAGVPKEVLAALNTAVVEALADPAVRARIDKLGQDIPPRELQTPEGLAAYHKAEIEKWWPAIKAAGIRMN